MANVLVLRTCNPDLTSHGGFQWPKKGPVKAPDWEPTKECGNGLHGFLWGEGDGTLASFNSKAKWLVVRVAESDVVNLGDKVKFPKGSVVFCGTRLQATDYLHKHLPLGLHAAIIGASVTVSDNGTATAGPYGTATAGQNGTATAGDNGTATVGPNGTATAGRYGTATAGPNGTATAGESGKATAGEGGTLQIQWYDGNRYRIAIFYVGEDGIEANVPYRCVNGKAVKAS